MFGTETVTEKIITIILIIETLFLCIAITGALIRNSDNTKSDTTPKFVEISSNGEDTLVYDKATKIVYLETYTFRSGEQHTPYFAPNGKPYAYNTGTKKLEEVTVEVTNATTK